jgi:hypothetical protein
MPPVTKILSRTAADRRIESGKNNQQRNLS